MFRGRVSEATRGVPLVPSVTAVLIEVLDNKLFGV